MPRATQQPQIPLKTLLTFIGITFFYFFEFGQMSYFNALAPDLLNTGIYTHHQIGALSAAYYYGNVIGLLPAGFILDHLPLRKTFIIAIIGSVLGALLLATTRHYSLALAARCCCGFFGGTFSFVGGIRLLVNLFHKRFTLFMGIFLTTGMAGGLACQYPLLWLSNTYSPHTAIIAMLILGILVLLYNLFALHPNKQVHTPATLSGRYWSTLLPILKNYRNWTDCLLIIFLDSPFTILGALWGVVTLSNLYHFTSGTSALIMTVMFAGSIIGSLLFGILSERYQKDNQLVLSSTGLIFLLLLGVILIPYLSAVTVALVFFAIGLLTGTQTIVFSWLTKNMRPEVVGRNSAMNSMLFMGAGGVLKQVCAGLLVIPALMQHQSSSINLLILIAAMMLISTAYVLLRRKSTI